MEILKYYLPKIRELLTMLKTLEKDPMGNKSICLSLQEKLITSLTKIEYRIQKTKTEVSTIKQLLGNKALNNTKEEAKRLKTRSKSLYQKIDQYQQLRILFKSIGDGIAFIYINRFDLKTQNFKQSTGFISNKKGNRLERRCFRHVFNAGGIGIMNDLTNVLKYFDLTIILGIDQWLPIEIKSGSSKNKVQADKGEALIKYIKEDKPTDVYEMGTSVIRQSLTSEIHNYVDDINELIGKAKLEGVVMKVLEPGLVIVAVFENYNNDIEGLLDKIDLNTPLMFSQNNYSITEFGYYPYSLSIRDTEDYLDFLSGKLQMFHFFDLSSIKLIADKFGYDYEFLGEYEKFVKFTKNKGVEFAISQHSFSRIFFEYISPSWLINDHFLQVEEMTTNLEKNPEFYNED